MRRVLLTALLLVIIPGYVLSQQARDADYWMGVLRTAEAQCRAEDAQQARGEILKLRPYDYDVNMYFARIAITSNNDAKSASRYLYNAIEGLLKDHKSLPEVRKQTVHIMMGDLPTDWSNPYGNRIYPRPFDFLTKAQQKHLVGSVPRIWIFPDQIDQAIYLGSNREDARAVGLLTARIMQGAWERSVFVLFGGQFSSGTQITATEYWRAYARKTGNPNLWLAVIGADWHLGYTDDLKMDFPSALSAIRRNRESLSQLAQMVKKMRWEPGIGALREIDPSLVDTAPKTYLEAIGAFDRALWTGNRKATEQAMRTLNERFPGKKSLVGDSQRIRSMLQNGWRDMAEKTVASYGHFEDWQLREYLLQDAAARKDEAGFDRWMRRFLDPHRPDMSANLILSCVSDMGDREPERAVDLLKLGLKYCPGNHMIRDRLAYAYTQAGYKNRAVSTAEENMGEQARAGEEVSGSVNRLIDATRYTKDFAPTSEQLWKKRDMLMPSDYVRMAREWGDKGQFDQALKWIDEAIDRTRHRRWTPSASSSVPLDDPSRLTSAYERVDRQKQAEEQLFTPELYEFRLRCLGKLRMQQMAKLVLTEAKRRYPDRPFITNVPELVHLYDRNWQDEDRHHSKLRELPDVPTRCTDLFTTITMMGFMTKSIDPNGPWTIEKIEQNMAKMGPQWPRGFRLAIAIDRDGMQAIVPYVVWAREASPKETYLSNPAGRSTVDMVLTGFIGAVHRDLGAAFYLASYVTAPEGTDESVLRDVQERYVEQCWKELSSSDRQELARMLKDQALNPKSLELLRKTPYSPGIREWVDGLRHKPVGTRVVAALSSAVSYTGARFHGAGAGVAGIGSWVSGTVFSLYRVLAGLAGSASRAIASIFHSIGAFASSLGSAGQVASSSAQAPPTSVSQQASNQVVVGGPPDPAALKSSAMAALSQARSSYQRAEALARLAYVEPADAPNRLSALTPDLLIADPNGGDVPTSLSTAGSAVFTAVEKDKSLARNALPILQRMIDHSPDLLINLRQQIALIHVWAGDTDAGVAALTAGARPPFSPLPAMFGLLLRGDMPSEARPRIVAAIENHLRDTRPSLTALSEYVTQNRVLESDRSPEGVTTLSQILEGYLNTQDGLVPGKFREMTTWWLYTLANNKPTAGKAADDWYGLMELTYRRAAKTPSDEKMLATELSDLVTRYGNDSFQTTESYTRLKKLAEGM